MGFFDNVRNSLMDVFGLVGEKAQQGLKSGFQQLSNPVQAQEKVISPLPDDIKTRPLPTPTPAPQRPQAPPRRSVEDLTGTIQSGLERFSPGTPLASQSAQLAQAGQDLPDQLLPVLVALAETRGGKDLLERTRGANNPFNIMYGGDLIDYPDLSTAILGGGGSRGFSGLMRPGGLYEDYRQSGDLSDFLSRFSPFGSEYGNPEEEQQLSNYAYLRSLFE